MSDTKCKCFTCTHKDTKLLRGYYEGYVAASDWFLNWAEKQHVQAGHIADDDLPGIVAQMMYNREESAYLLEEAKTMERGRRRVNQRKYVAHAYKMGLNDWHKVRVKCVETGVIYDTMLDAARAMGLKSTSGIRYCLQGVYKTSGGHKWVKLALEQKD